MTSLPGQVEIVHDLEFARTQHEILERLSNGFLLC